MNTYYFKDYKSNEVLNSHYDLFSLIQSLSRTYGPLTIRTSNNFNLNYVIYNKDNNKIGYISWN